MIRADCAWLIPIIIFRFQSLETKRQSDKSNHLSFLPFVVPANSFANDNLNNLCHEAASIYSMIVCLGKKALHVSIKRIFEILTGF